MFKGSYVALVTPMTPAGDIDYTAYERLIEWHLDAGTDGFVVLGTTAESPTIRPVERLKIIEMSLAIINKERPVIVGTGSNCTHHTIELTRQAYELGADAALLVAPYYNRPTQEGLFLHHKEVAKAVPIPQILYNVPSRTGCDLLPETALRISECDNVIGIKETVMDVARFDFIVKETPLQLFSGTDAINLEMFLRGASGIISVVANVIPQRCRQLCQLALAGLWDEARALDELLQPLFNVLFVESNPIPAKWALYKMGKIDRGIRLPLTWLSEHNESVVRQALLKEGITCAI